MAEARHMRVLRKGRRAWNSWRAKNPSVPPDLSDATIRSWVDRHFDPEHVGAGKKRTDFTKVNFKGAYFRSCRLTGSDFTAADLTGAKLEGCDLTECNFRDTKWSKTIVIDCGFSGATGMEAAVHRSASVLDHRTLLRNPSLNIGFLRGVGLPDSMIEYLPSLTAQPIDFYSCFISYSSKDEEFTRRVHADLQDHGVRCWYAPEDLKIGDRTRDTIDQAIKIREKLLLVLSVDSIESAWVEKEVETAFEEERFSNKTILFPIMIDNAMFSTNQSWAADIRRTRHVGDFRSWADFPKYAKSIKRLFRDLRQSA